MAVSTGGSSQLFLSTTSQGLSTAASAFSASSAIDSRRLKSSSSHILSNVRLRLRSDTSLVCPGFGKTEGIHLYGMHLSHGFLKIVLLSHFLCFGCWTIIRFNNCFIINYKLSMIIFQNDLPKIGQPRAAGQITSTIHKNTS